MPDFIYDLYTEAAYEFPETSQRWMPSWLTKHKAFEQVKGSRVFKVFEKFGLKDFRQPITNPEAIEDFKDFLQDGFSSIVNAQIKMSKTTKEIDDLAEVCFALNSQILNPQTWIDSKHRLLQQVASQDKKIRIDAGTSLVKAYNAIRDRAAKLGIQIPNMEASQAFRNYSKRGNVVVVFSTDPNDIASMASRSTWGSCQTLDGESEICGVGGTGLQGGLIGSSLSKFVGIIYITSGSDYENRGEVMIARCLVRFVVDLNTNQPTIILDKMYPGYNDKFARHMINELQKRTSVPVMDAEGFVPEKDTGRYVLPEEKLPIKKHEKSYLDNAQYFSEKVKEENEGKVSDPSKFVGRYIDTISDKISKKLALYIKRNFKITRSQFSDLDEEVSDECKDLLRGIISSSIKRVTHKVFAHYKSKKPQFSSFMLKSYLDKEVLNQTEDFINNYIKNYNLPDQRLGFIRPFLRDEARRKMISEFIYNQIINNL